MNNKYNKLLHYMLIIFLMLAPVRSVFASQFMSCDKDMSSSDVAAGIASLSEHCKHMQNQLSASTKNGVVGNVTADTESSADHLLVKRCCDSNSACSADCHISISLSLYLPPADYSPVFISTGTFDKITTALLVRELSPPSRPPLSLYS